MTQPSFGLQFDLLSDTILSPTYGDFSVLGIVLPSDDANATTFPLDTPVDINTGDSATLAALGTGPLYKAILRVNSQLADLQRSARAIVVRVATGTDDYETMVNIIGNADTGTGIYALLKAPQLLGVTPRLLGSPGFTGTLGSLTSDTDAALGVWRAVCDLTGTSPAFVVYKPDGSVDGVALVGTAYDSGSGHGPNFTLTQSSTHFRSGERRV